MPAVQETTIPPSQFRIYGEDLVAWLNSTGFVLDGFPLIAVYASPEKAFGAIAQILAEQLGKSEAERWKKAPMAVLSVQYLGHVFDPSRNRGYNTYLRNAGYTSSDHVAGFKARHPRPVNIRWQIEAEFVYRDHAIVFGEWIESQQAAGELFRDVDFMRLWPGWGVKTISTAVDGVTDNSELVVGETDERMIRLIISATTHGWWFYGVETLPTVQEVRLDVRLAPAETDVQTATVEDSHRAPFVPDDPMPQIDVDDGSMTPWTP